MTLRELLPSSTDNDTECRCTSCRHLHKVGDRSCIRNKTGIAGWKDYCPKCLKGRSYIECPVQKKNYGLVKEDK
jgi:hypothetical protein